MKSKQLREAVKAKLNNIGERALNLRITKVMDAHPTISRNDALLLVAVNAGIRISRYVTDQATLDRVRQLQTPQVGAVDVRASSPKRTRSPRTVQLRIASGHVTDPVLPERIIMEAKRMAERAYPTMYLFENSVREVIQRVLTAAYGQNWWDQKAPPDVRRVVEGRMRQEESRHWHGKRGAHPIYYTDVEHLRTVIEKEWTHFSALFPSQVWVTQRIEEINVSRRVIAHNNPLDEDDLRRLDVYYSDWRKQTAGVSHLIP